MSPHSRLARYALIPLLLIGTLVVGALIPAAAGRKSKELKISLKAPSGKHDAGGLATMKVKLKNRTKEARTVVVTLAYLDDPDNPFSTESYDLDPKEKRTVLTPCPIPAGYTDSRLRVLLRAEGLEATAKVKVRPAGLTDAQWLEGRELYRSECGTCHGSSGGGVKNNSLDRWMSAMASGPGSMPRYPDLTRDDAILMREYTRDADRVIP